MASENLLIENTIKIFIWKNQLKLHLNQMARACVCLPIVPEQDPTPTESFQEATSEPVLKEAEPIPADQPVESEKPSSAASEPNLDPPGRKSP